MTLLQQTPRSRTRRLLVEEVDGETLAYDLETHEAHCLNPAAAAVWKHSDGATTVERLAERLSEVGLPNDPVLVWMALERLDRAGLLEGSIDFPGEPARFSRKEVLRILGRAAGIALVLPAVSSVRAPLAAQAASCISQAMCQAITARTVWDCTGLPICGTRNKCCVAKVKWKKGVPTIKCRKKRCP